ncbi:MAG: hypothetical protein ACHQ4G_00145 [Opitutales bacterium]
MKSLSFVLILALAGLAGSSAASACSACGCSLSSDWGLQAYAGSAGTVSSLRFEYFDQDNLRRGTQSVNRSLFSFPADQEIQQSTVNRIAWFQFDRVFTPAWALSVQVPFYDRDHATVAEGDTAVSTSRTRGFGDAKVIGRFQVRESLFSSWNLQLGLKLPSGRFDQNFATGPQAGTLLDRGLQLGTGTTDLIVGGGWYGRPQPALGVFAQVLADQPLAARAGFIPGSSVTVSDGLRWLNSSSFTPEMQLNVNWQGREHGPEADTPNSGGTLAYLSPGITADLSRTVSAFAFVQLPVYQRVNGLQLEPHWLLSTGLNWRW